MTAEQSRIQSERDAQMAAVNAESDRRQQENADRVNLSMNQANQLNADQRAESLMQREAATEAQRTRLEEARWQSEQQQRVADQAAGVSTAANSNAISAGMNHANNLNTLAGQAIGAAGELARSSSVQGRQ